MEDQRKSKKQLQEELAEMRRRVAELSTSEAARIKAEEALKESEARYQALLASIGSGVAVFETADDGTTFYFKDFNEAAERIDRISRSEVVGKDILDLFPEMARFGAVGALRRVYRTGRPERLPVTYYKDPYREGWRDSCVYKLPSGDVVLIYEDVTERETTGKALRESRALFRAVLDSLDAGVYVVDMDSYEILLINEYTRRAFGDVTGEICWKTLQKGQDGPCPFCTNARLLTPDGEPAGVITWEFCNTVTEGWYECHDMAIPWPDGRLVRLEIVTDIGERKRAEEALRDTEKRYRHIFENATVGIYRSTPRGTYLHVNPAFARILGYSSPEECMSSITDISRQIWLYPDERREGMRILNEKGSLNMDLQVRTKDGGIKWASTSVIGVRDGNGEVVAYEGFLQDITEGKNTETALKESEARYRSIFENSPLGIFQSTLDGRFLKANSALARMLGYDSPRDAIDSIHDIAGQVYAEPAKRAGVIRKTIGAGEALTFENEYLRRDGSKWIGHLTLSVVPGEDGVPHHLDGIVEDITEKKAVEEKLQSTMKHLRTLSHRLLQIQETERRYIARELHDEMGQTLTALRINLKAAERAKKAESASAAMDEAVGMVDGLIKQVRHLSTELRPSILDDFGLTAALDWYVSWLASRTGLKAMFFTDFTEERLSPLLELTCFRIAQEALTNVVRHANAGTVRVELRRQGDEIHLQVKDDGNGFHPEKTREGALKGQSFGLLGMEERASLIGGHLEIRSEIGRGAEIHACFPLEQRASGGFPLRPGSFTNRPQI